MWRLEKNPEHIRRAYTTDNPIRLARDVLIGEYEQKPHMLNFKPLCIISRGHSGSRCLSWIIANLHYYFGKVYNLSGDSYHTTPEIRRRQNAQDHMHDAIIETANKYLLSGDWQLSRAEIVRKYQLEIVKLRKLFSSKFLDGFNSDFYSGWCWKDTDSYLIFPIFYEVLRPYEPVFLHLIRDGRDISFKIHRTDSVNEAPGPALMNVLGNTPDTPQYIRSATSWAFQVKQFLKWGAFRNMIEIRYEEMCSKPTDCVQKIFNSVGVPEGLYDLDQITSPIYSDRIGQYKQEDSGQIEEVELMICDILQSYGY